MEKASKYKSRTGGREVYSIFEEKIQKEEERRFEIRKTLEIVIEAIGQAVALQKRMQEEWEKGNLQMTPEISTELDKITHEFLELKEKSEDLSRQYGEVSERISNYRRQNIKEDKSVAEIAEIPEGKKMN